MLKRKEAQTRRLVYLSVKISLFYTLLFLLFTYIARLTVVFFEGSDEYFLINFHLDFLLLLLLLFLFIEIPHPRRNKSIKL